MRYLLSLLVLAAVACRSDLVAPGGGPSTPANLTYQLEPSGDPNRPLGILLIWDDVTDANLANYRVYSRAGTSDAFGLRGETTSNTFHDNGVPHLQYVVTAVDANGGESGFSNAITVDERLQLVAPAWLSSISLNGAIHLQWDDTSYASAPTRFKWYRIYSTAYNLDTGLCDTNWLLEGTTVAPEFLASALTNGVPRCFGVSAVSREGYESLWSPLHQDTPRPDARNTLVFAIDANGAQSGFRFWQDANGDGRAQTSELGLVVDGHGSSVDFWVDRKSTRLNSSHLVISYAVFCLKKKNNQQKPPHQSTLRKDVASAKPRPCLALKRAHVQLLQATVCACDRSCALASSPDPHRRRR